MTQNLDYNGGGVATMPENWGDDENKARYFDPGMYVKRDPTNFTAFCNGVKGLNDTTCEAAGWVNVQTGYTPSDTAMNSAVISGTTYDAHYLIGNYYSWLAAASGSGKDLWEDGLEAPGSICPKGWQLPLSGDSTGSNNNRSGSFRNLLDTYGFSFNDNGVSESLEGIVSGTKYNIADSPLYFLRGGNVSTASLDDAGIVGVYWSRTASSGTTAYYLAFSSADVYPSYSNSRFYGFSIRCVVI